MKNVLEGLGKFQSEVYPRHRELFERLAHNQQPSCLFITCSDSRVVPNLILQADPGELFLIRNAGNIVPPHPGRVGGTMASIEYAVEALGIRDVILCGHTNCGAMKGILHPEMVSSMPFVASWVQYAAPARDAVHRLYPDLPEHSLLDHVVEQNVIHQIKNLLTHPSIRSRVATHAIELYGWVYDIVTGHVRGLDESGERFVDISFDTPGSPDERLLLSKLEADESTWEKL